MSGGSLAPFTCRIRQRLPGARPIDDYATETVVVCNGDEQPLKPAIFPAGELQRVTGVHELSAGLDDELNLATQTHAKHTPTVARRYSNLCLTSGMLCNYRSYKRMTFGQVPLSLPRLEVIDETVAFCSTDAGNDYFAHFLLDDACTAMLATDFGLVAFDASTQPRTEQMLEYLKLIGIPFNGLGYSLFRDIWVFTDHAQNRHRSARLVAMRDRIRSQPRERKPAAPVYIRRGSSGTLRLLENEAAIERRLQTQGFRIIDPNAQDAATICALLHNSPLVVGVEGSQLAHGVLNMAPGGALLCIQPAARFNAIFRSFCSSLNLDWSFIVADGAGDRFRVAEDRLLLLVDRLLNRSPLSC